MGREGNVEKDLLLLQRQFAAYMAGDFSKHFDRSSSKILQNFRPTYLFLTSVMTMTSSD